MGERLINPDAVHFKHPVDEAFFQTLRIMLGFCMGEEEAEKAIAGRESSIYTEGARPIMAVVHTYLLDIGPEKGDEVARLFGLALQESRESCELTIQDMAKALGVKPSEIMSLEEGEFNLPSLNNVFRIKGINETLPDELEKLIAERQATV